MPDDDLENNAKVNLVKQLLDNGIQDYIDRTTNPSLGGFLEHVHLVATGQIPIREPKE